MAPKNKKEDALLEERIKANKIEYPRMTLMIAGFLTALIPTYYAVGINGLEWAYLFNIPIFIFVLAASSEMLTRAYSMSIESEFWKRQRHYTEVAGADEGLLRRLRLQASLGYSLFFINIVFLGITTLLQAYLFRNMDPRACYFLSTLLAAALAWLLAEKNEESRRRRLGGLN